MPKIIPGLEEKIIDNAKKILFTEGYDSLSMRRMASDCNIAVGTLYNYIKDKNDLVAKIALNDWIKTSQKIIDINEYETDFAQGIITIFKYVKEFNNTYISYWTTLTTPKYSSIDYLYRYHPLFRVELQKLILPLMDNYEEEKRDIISKMLAELITSLVTRADSKEEDLRLFIKYININ